MSNRYRSSPPYPSSPATPGLHISSSPPLVLSTTPVTPPQEQYDQNTGVNLGLGSPFEAPNDKRKKASQSAQGNVVHREFEQALLEFVPINRRIHFIEQLHPFLDQHNSLQSDHDKLLMLVKEQDKKLAQVPEEKYIHAIESQILEVGTVNSKLRKDVDAWKLLEQTARMERDKLVLDFEELQRKFDESKEEASEKNYRRYETGDEELLKELKRTKEEFTALYEECVRLQQENETVKWQIENSTALAGKGQGGGKDSALSEAERSAFKKQQIQISDALSVEIERRMAQEGSMFEEIPRHDPQLESLKKMIRELKNINASQQREIEALRNGIDEDGHSCGQSGRLNQELPSLASSLGGELGDEMDQSEEASVYSQTGFDLIKSGPNGSNCSDSQVRDSQRLPSGDQSDDKTSNLIKLEDRCQKLCQELQVLLEDCKIQPVDDPDDTAFAIANHAFNEMTDLFEDFGFINENETHEVQTVEHGHSKHIPASEKHETILIGRSEMLACRAKSQDNSTSLSKSNGHSETTEQVLPVEAELSWMERLGQFLDVCHTDLNEGVTDEDQPLSPWPTISDLQTFLNRISHDSPMILEISSGPPTISKIIWTEMLCLGRTYWTELALKDRIVWARLSGPYWWSLIIQLLLCLIVPIYCLAWWCITAANMERDLWMEANEVSYRKYWDTSVWGAEKGFLWRLLYGLGYV